MTTASMGATIRRLRRERGWTQTDLARELSVHRHTIHRWEARDDQPTPFHQRALARLFGAKALQVAA